MGLEFRVDDNSWKEICIKSRFRQESSRGVVCPFLARMMRLLPLVLLAGASFALPSPRANHVLHEKRAREPRSWTLERRLEPHVTLPLRIGLTQSNLHKIEDMLMAVSHPESLQYGKHFTPAEIIETFAPQEETVDAVKGWLMDFGIAADRLRLSASKGWLEVVNATVAEAEDLLSAEYHVFTHPSGAQQISM